MKVQDGSAIDFENLPPPRFWMEGSSGAWGPGNPWYETHASHRKKLLGYLNSYPSTLTQLSDVFGKFLESIHDDVTALEKAGMLRGIDKQDEKPVYAPTFAILSAKDFDLLYPSMAAACRAYAKALSSRLDEIDAIVSECGLDIQGRWPLLMAFIRDEMFYTYMDEQDLFAQEDNPFLQEGNFYGVEPYSSLDSKSPFGLTHSRGPHHSFIYIYPYPNPQARSLFEQWGFKYEFEATEVLDVLLWTMGRETPSKVDDLAQCLEQMDIKGLKALVASGHIRPMINYLEAQGVVQQAGDGYVKKTAHVDNAILSELQRIADPATKEIAKLLKSSELEKLYKQTCAGRNGIPMGQFREVVGWKTVWTATGFVKEWEFLPDLTGTGRELFVFERRDRDLI